jgi:hypothetical protein
VKNPHSCPRLAPTRSAPQCHLVEGLRAESAAVHEIVFQLDKLMLFESLLTKSKVFRINEQKRG